jgi:uncharacterized iron-regulated protein
MDPITTAIVAALAAGVASGATEVGKKVIVDAYDTLKTALKNKFGADSDLVDAVDKLEKKPDSGGRKEVLQEEVAAAKADQDPEILKAAQDLIDQVKAQPGGEQHIQTAIGSYIAQADRGGTATVSVNQPKE